MERRIAKLKMVSTEKVTAPLIRLMCWWLPRVLLGSCLQGRSLGISIEYSLEWTSDTGTASQMRDSTSVNNATHPDLLLSAYKLVDYF